MEFAIESADDGYFEIDLETMIYTPNLALAISLGFEPSSKDMTTLSHRIHPDDRDQGFAEPARCKSGLATRWNQDLRIRIASGG